MYYKGSKAESTPDAPIDMGIIASAADRVLLTSEHRAAATELAESATAKTTHDIEPGNHIKIPGSRVEHAVPISTESSIGFVVMPLSMFERTKSGKLKPLDSDSEGFDAPESTGFIVVESSPPVDGEEVVTKFIPLSEESRTHNAKEVNAETGEEKPLFDIYFGNKGSVLIGNSSEAKISVETTDETAAERKERVAAVANEAGRIAVASLIERATKTEVASEAFKHADAKRLREIRKAEIKSEKPGLKVELKAQKTIRNEAKSDLRSAKRETSNRKLKKERRAMIKEAMAQYEDTNPHATGRERRGMKKGIKEVAGKDVARAAAEKLARATNKYGDAYKKANDTRRRIHEGSRLYAVGGRNTVTENRGILAGYTGEHRGQPGSLFDLDDQRKKAILAEVEAKRVREQREKYRDMQKARLASRTADRARVLHSSGTRKST